MEKNALFFPQGQQRFGKVARLLFIRAGWLIFRADPAGMSELPYASTTHLPPTLGASQFPACRLSLLIHPERICYVLTSPGEELAACREFANRGQISPELFLRFVLEKEAIFREAFGEIVVYSAAPEFSLLPGHWQDPASLLRLARLMLDDTALPEELRCHALPGEAAALLFLAAPGLQHLLDRYLSAYRLSHLAAPLLRLARELGRQHPSLLLLHVSPSHVMALALRGGQLSLCNAFPWRVPADMAYFAQSVRKVCGLDLPDVPVFAVGELEEASPDALALWLPGLRRPEFLALAAGADLREAPWWRFAFLAQPPSGLLSPPA
jgi:hypothetical protein